MTLRNLHDDQLQLGLAAAVQNAGDHPLSAGQLHSLCIAEYANAAAAQRQRLDYEQEHGSEPRFHCDVCEDRGSVYVWNPAFLAAYRGRWQGMLLTERPLDWEGQAYSWWRKQSHPSGSMRFLVRCDCHGARTVRFAEEQGKFAGGDRDRQRPPACGMGVFEDGVTPLASADPAADLTAHYQG